ncbi:MAG: aldo/keto reductase [Verrucomicrobia bacterium]|nr:aldo/keto reductase [Verrucomicrobiota bacterium]MCH8514463.1 aldo/keto reductase [Kiritimatiellia bacterium]
MNTLTTRTADATGTPWTEIGLGCWQLGGGWGAEWSDEEADRILESAYVSGVRFFDTADVYGGGSSERSLAPFLARHDDAVVATKLGRDGLYPDGYTRESLRKATDASRQRLGLDQLPLTQLHCVPAAILRRGEIFDWMREQQSDGLIRRFGASVESVEEGLLCLEQEGISSLQVIFNLFRQKPAAELLPRAREKGVAIIVRLPLASGLLTGKLRKDTTFLQGDHRNFNRDGSAFNVGETFAGLPYETGVELAEQLAALVPKDLTPARMSLRWILDHPAVTVVIPGASSPAQAEENAAASTTPPLPHPLHLDLADFYARKVHTHIRGPY